MAEDLDVEAMLEAPYKKGVSPASPSALYRSLLSFFFLSLYLFLSFDLWIAAASVLLTLVHRVVSDGETCLLSLSLSLFIIYALAAV